MKHVYIIAGWVSVALGIIGMILPVMPTTCFMLLGAYFFSKGSPKLHQLLRSCPKFGPIICEWEEYHVIRIHPKLMATGLISVAGFVLFVVGLPLVWLTLTLATMSLVLIFIWTRPSTIEASLARRSKRLAPAHSSEPLK